MAEKNDKIQVKSFNHKWYGFIITYATLNIFFFISINSIINNIYKIFSQLFSSKVLIDGADFSIFSNLLAMPIFIFLVIANVGITILCEFIAILLFKTIYLKSKVKAEDSVRLYQYTKTTLLCFMAVNLLGAIFYGDFYRIIFYTLLYSPIPLFIFLFICSKIKRFVKEENSYKAEKFN